MILHLHQLKCKDDRSSRPDCMRTGNDEIMNANYDLNDQQTLTGSNLNKTRAL